MGSYLSKLGLSPGSPTPARTDLERPAHRPARPLYQVHRIQHVHRAQPARRQRLARSPPNWDPTNPSAFVNEAWRRFPMKRPQNSIMGPLPSDWWESYLKRNIWSLRHPRATWSPVMVRIAPPEQRARPSFTAAVVIKSAGPSEEKPPPDPCAKETVLRALWLSRKERVGLEESLFPAGVDSARGTPEARRSAFKPLINSTAIVSFVPRPGPLKRGHHSQSSDYSLKRSSRSSADSVTSTPTRGSLVTKRNAISSSYSSRRDFSEPLGRRFPSGLSIQEPEWPLKKRGKSHHSHTIVATASDAETSGTSGSSGQANQEVLQPLSSLGHQLSQDLTLEKQAGLPWGSEDRKDAVMTATEAIPEARPGTQPPPDPTSSFSGTVPTAGTDPQLHSSKEMLESPGPPSTGADSAVAPSPLSMPIPLARLDRSQPELPPGTSCLSKLTTASALQASSSPTSPLADLTRPSTSPEADGSAAPLHSAPTSKSPLRVPASVAPAHSMLKPTWDPQHTSEVGGALDSRIPVAESVSSGSSLSRAPGILIPTFTPVFGSMAQPKTVPALAPVPARQSPLPVTPVSPHLSQGLAKSTSAAMPTTSTSTAKDAAFKPCLDLSVVKITHTVGSTCSVPASCQSFPLGPATGFVSPAPQHPAIPSVHTVAVFTQVLMSTSQVSPLKSTANLKGAAHPLSASGLAPPNQPAVEPGTSNPTSAFTTPLGSDPKPSCPPFPAGTSQHSSGAVDGQKKPCVFQSAPAPSVDSSFLLKDSITSPTPRPIQAQPVLDRTTQSALGGLTPPAYTLHIAAGIQPGFSSIPTDPSVGEASSTGLEVAKQSHQQSGPCGAVFGMTAPRPFAFGGLVAPMDCEEPETIVAVPQVVASGVVLNGTTRALDPFAQAWSQTTPSQGTPLASGTASFTPRNTLSEAPSALSIPVSGPLKAGSSTGFGMSFSSIQGSTGKDAFRSWTPLFSVGAKSKPPRTREHGQSRRHHAYKK